jgi:hypothetical protein
MSNRSPSLSVFRPAKGVDQSTLEEHRALVADINRRNLLRGGVSLGALCSPAATSAIPRRCAPCCSRFRLGTTASRSSSSGPIISLQRFQKRRFESRPASTLIIPSKT